MALYDRLYNKERNMDRRNALVNALQASRLDTRNNITPFQPVQAMQKVGGESVLGGAGDLLSGAGNLYKGLQASGLFGSDKGSISESPITSAINNNVFDLGQTDNALTNAINNNVSGNTSETSLIGDAIGNSTGGNIAPYGGIIMGGLRSGINALGGGSFKDDVPQAFFGIDDSDSEIMQGLKGAGQGALMGLPFGGPIGAAVGGLLGLGASFLDDI